MHKPVIKPHSLTLATETLHRLSPTALHSVEGGVPRRPSQAYSDCCFTTVTITGR